VATLADLPLGRTAKVVEVTGARAFRRRLLEMGLVPGTVVRVVTVAPLGDPLQIEVRDGQWSMRRSEASQIAVTPT
jgi:ferrous iron transport protein A